MELVFATNNEHKLAEVRQMAGPQWRVLSLKEIGCEAEIPETSATLEGNALQKARWVHEHYGCDCFADDTGLEVDALGGAPGVYSARYAGEGHDSQANMAKLLRELGASANRTARFRTVIALILNDKEYTFEGAVEGEITMAAEGKDGFGYDPIFRPAGWEKTFAEATAEEKNSISHRGRATRKLTEFLKTKENIK